MSDRKVTYKLICNEPTCFDDGNIEHDEFWTLREYVLEAKDVKEAQIASLDVKYREKEHCYHGRHAIPLEISEIVEEKAADGWSRRLTSLIPLPAAKRCACGKPYWPIKGEWACHELRPATRHIPDSPVQTQSWGNEEGA